MRATPPPADTGQTSSKYISGLDLIYSPCSDQALDTLGRVARQNGKSMLLGRLVVDDTYGITRGRLADLLAKVSSHWPRRAT